MLSYEDIFRYHSPRPVSYLNSYLDSPITRIPKPVVLRSPLLYKERHRPTSLAWLDDISNKTINDSYSLTLKGNAKIFRDDHFRDNHRIVLKDITPRVLCDNRRPVAKELALKSHSENHRFPQRDKSLGLLEDSSKFPSSSKVLRDSHRLPFKDNKSRNFVDNYRHAVTFPDRHLSRREIPLCTPDELLDIIREPTGYYALPTDPWNEVYPGIYLSDAPTALCTNVLKRIGITHVLNAAQGREKNCGQVNTTPGFYSQSGIQFLGVPAFDNIVFRLYPYFEEAAEFIEDGLASKGKVLVHCRAGISRSATLVCAFLMMKRGLSVQEAVKTVRKNRAIIPNDGFLQQLCDLNDKLKQKSRY